MMACSSRLPRHARAFQAAGHGSSRSLQHLHSPARAGKGFGSTAETAKKPEEGNQQQAAQPAASSSTSKQEYAIEALEARMRGRRAKRAEAQVKVESAVVEAVSGKKPLTEQQKAEGNYVLAMGTLFGLIMLQGLLVAGSGFLPEDWDAFIQDVIYPNFTPTLGLLLAMSTAYGLWKIGKLPLPFLGSPPPQDTD